MCVGTCMTWVQLLQHPPLAGRDAEGQRGETLCCGGVMPQIPMTVVVVGMFCLVLGLHHGETGEGPGTGTAFRASCEEARGALQPARGCHGLAEGPGESHPGCCNIPASPSPASSLLGKNRDPECSLSLSYSAVRQSGGFGVCLQMY